MASKEPFSVDGLTVDQILKLDAETLNKMSSREMSRTLRTASLAANKRINNLLKYAVKRKTGEYDKKTGKPLYHYQEKKTGKAIATDALNYITDDGRLKPKFGVGDKDRNQMYKELARIREFMRLETSTVKGAVAVRKRREERILGKSREDYAKEQLKAYKRDYKKRTGKNPTKRLIELVKKQAVQEHLDMSSIAWSYFRTFLESEGLPNNPYHHFDESTEIIAMIGRRVAEGAGEAAIHEEARDILKHRYEASQEALSQEFEDMGGSDGLSIDY